MCSTTQITMSFTNIPSIYVPRVHHSITWEYMMSIFEEVLGEDTIKRIDIVKIKPRDGQKQPPFNRAYVHIKKWLPDYESVRDKLIAGESIKIEYDEPHYWLCLLNKTHQDKTKPKPRIIIDSQDTSYTLNNHMPPQLRGKSDHDKSQRSISWAQDDSSDC